MSKHNQKPELNGQSPTFHYGWRWFRLGSLRTVLARVRATLINRSSGETKIKLLRKTGVKIGQGCSINTDQFSSEPYLVEIGDHVAISAGTVFVTHDGAAWVFRGTNPHLDVFGQIKVGNNTFIGTHCLVLAGTTIGSNCVIGAGSVVRGVIPDNSVVMGNPGKVIFNTRMLEALLTKNKNALMTKMLNDRDKKGILLNHFDRQGRS